MGCFFFHSLNNKLELFSFCLGRFHLAAITTDTYNTDSIDLKGILCAENWKTSPAYNTYTRGTSFILEKKEMLQKKNDFATFNAKRFFRVTTLLPVYLRALRNTELTLIYCRFVSREIIKESVEFHARFEINWNIVCDQRNGMWKKFDGNIQLLKTSGFSDELSRMDFDTVFKFITYWEIRFVKFHYGFQTSVVYSITRILLNSIFDPVSYAHVRFVTCGYLIDL